MALSEEDVLKVKQMMQSSGWREVVIPALRRRGAEWMKESVRLPSERGKPYTDLDDAIAGPHIRGRIAELEYLLVSFQNELMVYEHNRSLDELDRSNGQVPNAANP